MDSIREFLISSTIHGLSHITKTKGLLRLFWMFVISTGFIGAGVLIKQSFESWTMNPVFTTIETLPITQIEFPKVTVCPPRKTFTNLNYDLDMIGNRTIDEETKQALLQYLPEAIYDANFGKKLGLYQKFIGEESYLNWYLGYSDISLPYYSNERLTYETDTSATSGLVSTPFFGEPFEEAKFPRYLLYKIYIHVPESVRGTVNTSLVVSVEYDVEKTSYMEYVKVGRGDYYDMNYQQLSPDEQTVEVVFALSEEKYYLQYFRRMRNDYSKGGIQSKQKVWSVIFSSI